MTTSVLARIAAHRPDATLADVLAEARAGLRESEANPSEYPVAAARLRTNAPRKEGEEARALRHLAGLLDAAEATTTGLAVPGAR